MFLVIFLTKKFRVAVTPDEVATLFDKYKTVSSSMNDDGVIDMREVRESLEDNLSGPRVGVLRLQPDGFTFVQCSFSSR
jgi:hypothetical protein